MNNESGENHETVLSNNSRAELHRLLREIIKYPDRRQEFTQLIEQTFGQKKAVLVLDMSGFSRTTQLLGIISFLLMIDQMRTVSTPCIEQNGGIVIKSVGDNLYCLFDKVDEALRAGREINKRLNAANTVLPVEHHLYASFGIGFGEILNIAGEDIFGDEVNLACKLGEDIANKSEILLSSGARAALEATDLNLREESVSICGISLTYFIDTGCEQSKPPGSCP